MDRFREQIGEGIQGASNALNRRLRACLQELDAVDPADRPALRPMVRHFAALSGMINEEVAQLQQHTAMDVALAD